MPARILVLVTVRPGRDHGNYVDVRIIITSPTNPGEMKVYRLSGELMGYRILGELRIRLRPIQGRQPRASIGIKSASVPRHIDYNPHDVARLVRNTNTRSFLQRIRQLDSSTRLALSHRTSARDLPDHLPRKRHNLESTSRHNQLSLVKPSPLDHTLDCVPYFFLFISVLCVCLQLSQKMAFLIMVFFALINIVS
ncbi:hypothetical protein PGT21_022247 [Puccinia graminis f. sp. tritici]|uniref:Uncharacterized protein n=1 Tax=Puccinia graminis f. sp. tritici TaxID=56615 RepID=A0A5B0NCU4_PUCGR|nr:hypothetical protein PGT21_022247 [Puccinia graminis f. sp. tritici]